MSVRLICSLLEQHLYQNQSNLFKKLNNAPTDWT